MTLTHLQYFCDHRDVDRTGQSWAEFTLLYMLPYARQWVVAVPTRGRIMCMLSDWACRHMQGLSVSNYSGAFTRLACAYHA